MGETDNLPGEDCYVVSDLHLGEGVTIEEEVRPSISSRLRGTAPQLTVLRRFKNPLEDFFKDQEFDSFLRNIIRERKADRLITLRLNGDVFDILAIRWKGRIDRNPPKERCALVKLSKIFRGHPVFFSALSWFLSQPNVRLIVTAGNHDLFLIWSDVQKLFVEHLVGSDPALSAKIKFIDHLVDFEDNHRRVLYQHGNHAEPQSAVDPKNAILTEWLGVKLKEPILNDPVGNIIVVRLMNRLKSANHRIGRIAEENHIWVYEAQYGWGWSLFAGRMLIWTLFSNMLTSFWDVRRKAGPIMVLRIAYDTWRRNKDTDPVVAYALRCLEERASSGIRAVVAGHSHLPLRITVPDGTVINSGTWAKQIRLLDAPIKYQWRRWRFLERIIRRLQLLNAKQKLIRILGSVAIVLATITFVWSSFQVNGLHLHSYDLSDFVTPAWILFWFWVAAFLFRTIAVEPGEVDATELTFVRIRHEPNDPEEKDLRIDLMVYDPQDDTFRDKV